MKSSNSLIDGYRELLFGQWMPHILFGQYEEDRLMIVDRLWNTPKTPSEYVELDSVLLTRWQALADSHSELSSWLPPFYQLSNRHREAFHPLCRFYSTLLWCENRMIVQVLHKWQEQLELTTLKYELVTLQNQLVDYLVECNNRTRDSVSDSDMITDILSRFLHSTARDSIIILLLEINERFSHLLEKRGLGLEEIFIRHLRLPVPSTPGWFSTVDRIKCHLKGIQQHSETGYKISKLLSQVKQEKNQQEPLRQDDLFSDSLHILENAWFCWKIFSEQKERETSFNVSEPEKHKELLIKWKQVLLGHSEPDKKNEEVHQEIFHTILNCLAEILNAIETEREPFSEAAEMTLLIKDIFSAEMTHTENSQISGKTSPSYTEGHWLLDQYIPLYQVQEKLRVTPRTMRTYINEHNLQVIEITAKSKWVLAEDFEAFMERFKKGKNL